MTTLTSQAQPTLVFEVAKNDLSQTRVAELNIEQPLADNEVLLKVNKFALTANNISYGITGDALGYWQFFPVNNVPSDTASNSITSTTNTAQQTQWGRLPVMGFADVVSSNNKDINVGERVWGFMPMATHFKIIAGKVNPSGFSDINPCREGLSPVYARFDRVSTNPFYQLNNEDYDILLRGLFTTSWLVDDFMFDNNYFDATQYLITSASSKTSIALAFAIKQRGQRSTVGITSMANLSFVESLGCYDHVISYNDITTLDANVASILVDMAGGKNTLAAIHHHFTQQLRYSCRIGATHHGDIDLTDTQSDGLLPGAPPTFFFAPTQLKKRSLEWGVGETMKQMNQSLLRYIDFCRSIITISHTHDLHHVNDIYQQVLAGTADASVGQIISLDPNTLKPSKQ
ncbi:DUF2855 family protein [Shewanella sp. ALD9]|uniref:DUF2855 family protein n=1 Tax=Shewanella sp. ALD9 TaxID=2058330 RepID=UPI000C336038|nr:DUF2855 family protein [Shewanella sp. ALD9]PKH28897.1 DUF2855 domain-containing protein [Shewanella sp. ALD9]